MITGSWSWSCDNDDDVTAVFYRIQCVVKAHKQGEVQRVQKEGKSWQVPKDRRSHRRRPERQSWKDQ